MPDPNPPVPPLPDVLVPYADALAEGPTRYGPMTWLRHDDPVGVALSMYGEWAQAELDLLGLLLGPGDTVVDAGSYVGTHALGFAAAIGPSGRVVACEPQPVVVDVLRRNAERTAGLVEVLQVAVGAEQGTTLVAVPAVQEHGNFGATPLVKPLAPQEQLVGPGAERQRETVAMVTVDSLGLAALHLLKVDVEGMEEQVLRGASRSLASLRPVVYAECNTLTAGVGVLRRLQDAGYDVHLHRAPAFNPDNVAGQTCNVFGVACETSLLAVPAERAGQVADLLADRPGLVPLRDVDDLAVEILKTPRYGDATAFDRDPAALLERLAAAEAAHAAAAGESAQARADADRTRDQVARERDRAEAALMRAMAGERDRDDALSALRQAQVEGVRTRARLSAVEASLAWRMAAPVRAAGEVKRVMFAHPAGRFLRVLALFATGRLPGAVRAHRQRTQLRMSGLFDDEFYLTEHPDVPPDAALDHYLAHGSREGRRPNPLFDGDWYIATYPDVAASGMNPLLHYAVAGAAEGRDPGPSFSTTYYLANNSDVRASGTNPLAHYLKDGRAEGRPALPPWQDSDAKSLPAPRPEPPSDAEWEAVAARPTAPGAPVVVVPVYKGYGETLRCLYSVLVSPVASGLRLIVVDDASPEPALRQALDRLADRGLLELVRNDRNLGFVRSVNRGMRLAGDADVVLLNSDTEVYGDWLDRLRATAWAAPNRASVTPLTNSGTIASYPRFARDNPFLLELPPEELDTIAARELCGHTVEIPTCVGFCVYLRADCLATVGLFDEEAFGLGYGEENDFSLRAAAAGWHHVLAPNVFVRHYGSTSFGSAAPQHQRAGLAVLTARYPDYQRLIAAHVAEDPAASARFALDAARLQRVRGGRPTVLLVAHGLGGGTAQHVSDLARRLDAAGVFPLLLRPRAGGTSVDLSSPMIGLTPNLRFPWADLPDADLTITLRTLQVAHIHVHHLQGYAEGAARIPRLATSLGVSYDVTLHDFMTVCPRVDMVDHTRRFCGGPEPEKCRRCISRNGSPFGRPDAAGWQEQHERFLQAARRVFVPSKDTASHVGRLFTGVDFCVRPHPEPSVVQRLPRSSSGDGMTHVAVLGALSIGKGVDLLLALAQDAERRGLPLHFHVFGYTSHDRSFSNLSNLSISGKYSPADLPDLIMSSGSTIALFPAVAPETFSYTLSEAVDLGLYPVSLDIGAVAERIRASGIGTVLPWSDVDRPHAVNDVLLGLVPGDGVPERRPASYDRLLEEYYELVLPGPTAG